jgi:MazG family protein
MQDKPGLDDTLALMRDLRARCEWDAAQTHDSLRPYLIEEAHELDDALRDGDDRQMKEELGDVLLQVLFHSVVAEERGAFDMHDVAAGLIAKMKARHPHLYGGGEKQSWESMKATKRSSLTEGLPSGLPSLHRAHRLQDRAAGVGFDWPDVSGPADKVEEELREVRHELSSRGSAERIEAEIGDLLFAVVNLARKAGVHPALALDKANAKFERRFALMEELARSRGESMTGKSLEWLDELWNSVKQGE